MSAVLQSPRPKSARFRPMREADLSAVMRLEQQGYLYGWTFEIFRDCLSAGYQCWLLEEAGLLLGYGVMSVAAGEAHLLNICVDPVQQGQGWGRHLLQHLLRLAQRHGTNTVFLEVRPSNTAACALYAQSGFNEVGLRRNYYPNGKHREDAVIMALELTGLESTAQFVGQ